MFGCIIAGRAVQTNLEAVSPTQFVFSLTDAASINNLTVFLLPDMVLPATHAATVHIRLPGQEFRLLGAISALKPSAFFRVRNGTVADGVVTLGISIEEVGAVEMQLAAVRPGEGGGDGAKSLRIAQKVIGNAFDYLASFGKMVGGEEVVPLKAFHEWWRKFEGRALSDPGFLDRIN